MLIENKDKGKLLIVAPDDTCGVSTLSRDAQAQNYHEPLPIDRDEFSQGSIPNPL